jgi:hypothetical protein
MNTVRKDALLLTSVETLLQEEHLSLSHPE